MNLTPTEQRILRVLRQRRKDPIVPADVLAIKALGYQDPGIDAAHVVRTHIWSLRRKLGRNAIVTVGRRGWQIARPA